MFGINGSEKQELFVYRGFNLLCKPSRLAMIQELLDKWEKVLHIHKLNTEGIDMFFINWSEFSKAVKDCPTLWFLLIALGLLSFEKNGNVEIRPQKDVPIVIANSSGSQVVYFTSETHARMCLVTVFPNDYGRHLYKYDNEGKVLKHEEIW